MRGEGYARFMELRGRRIVEAAGVHWYSVNVRIYMNIPYHEPLNPAPGELERMLRGVNGLGARFPSLDRAGLPSGLYVRRQKHYDLSVISPKQRTRVRRALESCQVRPVEESELLTQGLQCNLDTMERQARYDPEFGKPRQWKRLVNAIRQSPTVTPIGAFIDGRLAAYVITYREDGWLHILHQMSRRDTLHKFPNHVLTFQVTRQAAEDPSLKAVCYGLVGLVAGNGLHEYKLSFDYEVLPQNSVFLLHPAVAGLMNSAPMVGLVSAMRKLRPRNQLLERIESVLMGARLAHLGRHAAPRLDSDSVKA